MNNFQIIQAYTRSTTFIPPSLEELSRVAGMGSYWRSIKGARRAFQSAWRFAKETGLGAQYVAAQRPRILYKFLERLVANKWAYREWAQRTGGVKAWKRVPNWFREAVATSVRRPAVAALPAGGGGARVASRAAAAAGGAAKGAITRMGMTKLLKTVAQGTFKFAQSKAGAFTAALLGGLLALTIAGSSYVRKNPAENALMRLRRRPTVQYPRAPSGLVFALHATR